ncbi:hypothetical protein [Streptomyces hyaluromycini]|uniref:hypothetical protein n=1 Tax=Streptomyces hyaluromycini TaxID=1377993 RepID=UPI000B5C8FF7|nr:hypothetical protein [Streptomyces hyaluromycini]
MVSFSDAPHRGLSARRGLGPAFTPEAIDTNIGLFARLQAEYEFAAPRIQRDIAHGPAPRHRLDAHRGSDGTTGAPVLVFVHGGGLTGGDKKLDGMPFHDNVGGWAARSLPVHRRRGGVGAREHRVVRR